MKTPTNYQKLTCFSASEYEYLIEILPEYSAVMDGLSLERCKIAVRMLKGCECEDTYARLVKVISLNERRLSTWPVFIDLLKEFKSVLSWEDEETVGYLVDVLIQVAEDLYREILGGSRMEVVKTAGEKTKESFAPTTLKIVA